MTQPDRTTEPDRRTEPARPTGSPRSPVDSMGLWEAAAGLPEQLAEAVALGESVALPSAEVAHVVVLGVGADALAGDALAAVTARELRVPVIGVRSAELPAFVGPSSLVFAIAFSGGAPSTLAAAAAAWDAGASVVPLASRGPLLEQAGRAGAPSIVLPARLPSARAALGALVVPPLVVLDRLGLVSGVRARVAEAAGLLARRRDELTGPDSVALEVSRRIGRTFPLVHGAAGVGAVAASRWKTQVNENAKVPAFCSAHPELDYNELAGWGQSGDVTRQILTLVQLRQPGESTAVSRRFELVAEAIREVVADVVEVAARGDEDVARFFDLALVGDFVSLHLAAREGVDPGPVPVVTEIERMVGDL